MVYYVVEVNVAKFGRTKTNFSETLPSHWTDWLLFEAWNWIFIPKFETSIFFVELHFLSSRKKLYDLNFEESLLIIINIFFLHCNLYPKVYAFFVKLKKFSLQIFCDNVYLLLFVTILYTHFSFFSALKRGDVLF